MPWEVLTQLIQHGVQRGSRSTVLGTIGWMTAALITGLVGSITAKAPDWVQIFFAIMLGIDFFVFLSAFVYFGLTNPDARRSERFAIEKMAIEHGVYGDSSTGIIEARPIQPAALPPPSAVDTEGDV